MSIILATFNGRYYHSSLALKYLYANLKEYKNRCNIFEFIISADIEESLYKILKYSPKIIGLSVYIWNIEVITKFIKLLKEIRPDIKVVIGGPEVSFEYEDSDIFKNSDFLIKGEGELVFYQLVKEILDKKKVTFNKVIEGYIEDLDSLDTPYQYYSDQDIKDKIIYVESSRGCPFSCQFCISSIDNRVRYFDIDKFIKILNYLWDRGVRKFKFIDRTFNLKYSRCEKILNFFIDKGEENYFIHFEVVPDRISDKLKNIIKKFPKGVLQFEIGIQTTNLDVSKRVGRDQNIDKVFENIEFLNRETSIHIHSDLIAGLPGENLESFKKSFDQLISYKPDEIQVGILKRLKGTPIKQHTDNFDMVYNPYPPYNILKNKDISYSDLFYINIFAKYWEKLYNSGNFKNSIQLLIDNISPFESFWEFTKYSYQNLDRFYSISFDSWVKTIWNYLVDVKNCDKTVIAKNLKKDILSKPKRKIPIFLRDI